MLYKFSEIVKDFGIKPKGVLHIGANTGQEAEMYYANGVERTVWVEADPAVMPMLAANIASFPNAVAINATCHMISGLPQTLKITDNGSESSSILPMKNHKEKHPDVHVIGETPVVTSRIDGVMKEHNLDFADYPFVNIDVQGVELYVLKGFGLDNLKKVQYVYVEANKEEVYEGNNMFDDLNRYLVEYGFELAKETWTDNGWGDCFYIRKGLNTATVSPAAATVQTIPGQPAPMMPANYVAESDMKFAQIAKKRGLVIRGIINAGAHFGNDMLQYNELGIKNIMLLEPMPQAFEMLRLNYAVQADVRNVALSENNGYLNIYLSNGDEGRSNSLAYPNTFLSQYSNIKFQGNLSVMAQQLDSMGVDIGKYNAMHLDINGYELQALRGCLNFMAHCSYIYMKVYYADLWTGNAQLPEVQKYLEQFGFGLTDVSREGQTWGWALFIKKDDVAYPKKEAVQRSFADVAADKLVNKYLAATPENDFVQNVPLVFRPHIVKPFPVHNVFPFEEWYYANFNAADHVKDKVYLPIFWNSYYMNNDAANRPAYVHDLQNFINTLDPEKEYYTICMHHAGILNDVSKLKLTVFGVHPKSEIVLPPVCLEHSYQFDVDKDLFITYVGPRLHPQRRRLVEIMPADHKKFFISTDNLPLEDYCRVLARSRYVLCPVGFKGINYRMAEALQYGAMPILFSDSRVYNTPTILQQFPFVDDLLRLSFEVNKMEGNAGRYQLNAETLQITSVLEQTALGEYNRCFTYENCKANVVLDHFKKPSDNAMLSAGGLAVGISADKPIPPNLS